MSDLASRFSSRSDLHQSPMHAKVMADIGWQTICLSKGSNLYLRRLGPVSVAKLQRPKTINLALLNQLRKKYHILTLYLEPGLSARGGSAMGGGWSVEPFAHSCTSLVDLTLSSSQLLSSFNQNTRRNLKNSDITIRSLPLCDLSVSDIETFFTLQNSWSHLKHLASYPVPFMRAVLARHSRNGYLHIAYLGSTPVALLLVLVHDHVATYYIAFGSTVGYHHSAPTLLTWTAMLTARGQGCDIFDFGGIYDPRYPRMYRKWQGFTQFKAGFRPTVVTYPPTYLKLFW
ncbi:MAG: GNAT family N-acetyltransferase [bacterium]